MTLSLLLLAYTLSMCDRMILSILFPDIKAEFGLSDTQLGLLGGLSFALFYGSGRLGRRELFTSDFFGELALLGFGRQFAQLVCRTSSQFPGVDALLNVPRQVQQGQ